MDVPLLAPPLLSPSPDAELRCGNCAPHGAFLILPDPTQTHAGRVSPAAPDPGRSGAGRPGAGGGLGARGLRTLHSAGLDPRQRAAEPGPGRAVRHRADRVAGEVTGARGWARAAAEPGRLGAAHHCAPTHGQGSWASVLATPRNARGRRGVHHPLLPRTPPFPVRHTASARRVSDLRAAGGVPGTLRSPRRVEDTPPLIHRTPPPFPETAVGGPALLRAA